MVAQRRCKRSFCVVALAGSPKYPKQGPSEPSFSDEGHSAGYFGGLGSIRVSKKQEFKCRPKK